MRFYFESLDHSSNVRDNIIENPDEVGMPDRAKQLESVVIGETSYYLVSFLKGHVWGKENIDGDVSGRNSILDNDSGPITSLVLSQLRLYQ